MKVGVRGPFTVHMFPVPLIDSEYSDAARAAATRAVKELRESHSLTPCLELAVFTQLECAFGWGLLKGIVESNPTKAKQARDAIRLLKTQRRNAAKGAAARRDRGAKTRETIRQLDQELREKISKKGMRVQKIAAELGISTRTVERHLSDRR